MESQELPKIGELFSIVVAIGYKQLTRHFCNRRSDEFIENATTRTEKFKRRSESILESVISLHILLCIYNNIYIKFVFYL